MSYADNGGGGATEISITEIPSITQTKYSAWMIYKDARLYIRISSKLIGGSRRNTLELANIVKASRATNMLKNNSTESTGFMDDVMTKLERYAKEKGLVMYIENVHNDFLPDWFFRRGYVRVVDAYELTHCFYKE